MLSFLSSLSNFDSNKAYSFFQDIFSFHDKLFFLIINETYEFHVLEFFLKKQNRLYQDLMKFIFLPHQLKHHFNFKRLIFFVRSILTPLNREELVAARLNKRAKRPVFINFLE